MTSAAEAGGTRFSVAQSGPVAQDLQAQTPSAVHFPAREQSKSSLHWEPSAARTAAMPNNARATVQFIAYLQPDDTVVVVLAGSLCCSFRNNFRKIIICL